MEGGVKAFLKAGNPRAATDCAVQLNEWKRAVQIAEEHSLPSIDNLLGRYASKLLAEHNPIAAVELYRKAGRFSDSAQLLGKLAAEAGRFVKNEPLRAKKLYVLAALDAEKHWRGLNAAAAAAGGGKSAGSAVAAAVTGGAGSTGTSSSSSSLRTLDAAWQGAEAYHFFLLSQRQLYNGDVESTFFTAHRLALYESILDSASLYSILGLAAYYKGFYGSCSKALVKLEGMAALSEEAREQYSDTALSIFSRVKPADPPLPADQLVSCPGNAGAGASGGSGVEGGDAGGAAAAAAGGACKGQLKPWATHCLDCGAFFPACTATGLPLHFPAGALAQANPAANAAGSSSEAVSARGAGAAGGAAAPLVKATALEGPCVRCSQCRHWALLDELLLTAEDKQLALQERAGEGAALPVVPLVCPLCHSVIVADSSALAGAGEAGEGSGAAGSA